MDSYPGDFPFGIMDVVELLHLRIRRRQANSVYVDCPFCGDRRGKMNVNFVKNVWRCNYCDEHGGMLALYARLNNTTSTLNDWVEAYNEKLLNYRMPVYIFIMFIGVFGIINLLNTLITNILTRKRELGVLQAVGLSSKQLSKMLLIEGLFYTLGVLLLSISCGTLIGYLLCTVFSAMSIFGKVSYHFPTVEMFSYFILMLAVQMLFSCFAIRQIKKQSLVDQIRELS